MTDWRLGHEEQDTSDWDMMDFGQEFNYKTGHDRL